MSTINFRPASLLAPFCKPRGGCVSFEALAMILRGNGLQENRAGILTQHVVPKSKGRNRLNPA